MEEAMLTFLTVYLILTLLLCVGILLVLLAFTAVAYVLEGKSLYAIAKRRGIERPWLAWVPYAKCWLLGSISDQYRYVVHGQVRNRRKLLLGLNILYGVTYAVFQFVAQVVTLGSSFAALEEVSEAAILGMLGGLFLVLFLMEVALAAVAVFQVFVHMACYDILRSCEPNKSLVGLLVSIGTGVTMPFFLYSCRNKDLGMPPRQNEEESQVE